MGRKNPTWSGRGVTKKWDTWFSKAIRQRDGWRCRHCGVHTDQTASLMDCAHIQKRTHKSTRWDPANAVTLCRTPCHNYFETHPVEFVHWLEEEIGREALENLVRKSQQPMKTPDYLLEEISDHYRTEFNRMVKSDSHDLVPWGEAHEDDEVPLRRADSRAG